MVGFADKKSVKSLNTAGYMDNYYNSIYLGLFFLIISIIVTIIGIVIGKEYVVPLLIYIQQITFVGGILFFIKSIFGLMKLIKYIRNDDLYSSCSGEEQEDFHNLVRDDSTEELW